MASRKKHRNKNTIFIVTAIVVAVLIIAAVAGSIWYRSRNVIIHLNGKSTETVEAGNVYTESGYTAYFGKEKLDNIKIDGEVDTKKIGTYTLTYTAEHKDKSASATRTVKVVDTTAPVITVAEKLEVPIGLDIKKFDTKATANDSFEGDVTKSLVLNYDTADMITFSVSDTSGNKTEKAVPYVRVKDKVLPTISINGGNSMYVKLGSTYTDSGCKANDNIDGDITGKVKTSGSVDTSKTGEYKIVYEVTDSSDNKASAARTVTVYDPTVSNNTGAGGEKVVYLTFDDGPCVHTPEILKVLAKYGVKASFFVTNQFPKYQYLIGEEAKAGHTVAVHTFSHQYSEVYKNADAYFADLNKMNDVIKAQTGRTTNLVRFPGGSSNMVSYSYSKGIMKKLSGMLTERGYKYFDWNLASGDADGSKNQHNPDYIANNVIKNLGSRSYVVLMHDINKANIQSLPKILEYGLSHGYTFAPLDENSPTCHHRISN